jgi:hypothetical protein
MRTHTSIHTRLNFACNEEHVEGWRSPHAASHAPVPATPCSPYPLPPTGRLVQEADSKKLDLLDSLAAGAEVKLPQGDDVDDLLLQGDSDDDSEEDSDGEEEDEDDEGSDDDDDEEGDEDEDEDGDEDDDSDDDSDDDGKPGVKGPKQDMSKVWRPAAYGNRVASCLSSARMSCSA